MELDLDLIGRVLSFGFGDKAMIGMLMAGLGEVGPARVKEYINNDIELLYWASDTDWEQYRDIASNLSLQKITPERVMAELKKRQPQIYRVIHSTSGGEEWLTKELNRMKTKLRA